MENKGTEKKIIFIFGCQRSGTSITSATFAKIKNVKSYPETDNLLTDQDTSESHHTIRLNPLEDVKNKINNNKQYLTVVKPLVESQRALEIVNYFPNSRGMWLYRDYQDAVNSMVKKWGETTGIPHLKPILTNNQNNWRSEKLSDDIREQIKSLHKDGISNVDAWGLFWYARNSLFFSQDLQNNPKFVLLKYEKLVTSASYLSSGLKKIEIDNIDFSKAWNYNAKSVGKGKEMIFSEKVEQILKEMMDKLDSCES